MPLLDVLRQLLEGLNTIGSQPFLALITAIGSVLGILIAALLVVLRRQRLHDRWVREYQALHELFWGDEDMAEVRSWIASDVEYPKIEELLEFRAARGPVLERQEYADIEKLDKFFNLMLRGHMIFDGKRVGRKLSEGLYFDWWLQAIVNRGRERIHNYFRDLWPQSYETLFGRSVYTPYARTFGDAGAGPSLLVLGAIHGTEPCGTIAIRRFIEAMDRGELDLREGRVTLVPECNPRALADNRMYVDANLNRIFRKMPWGMRVLDRLLPQDRWWQEGLGRVYLRKRGWRILHRLVRRAKRWKRRCYEAHLAHELCLLVDDHDILLDLHSMTAVSQPCVFLDYASKAKNGGRENEALARDLGLGQALVGWPQLYKRSGPKSYDTAWYAHQEKKVGLTVECGENTDPEAPEVAYEMLLRTLEHFGLIDRRATCRRDPAIEWIAFRDLATRKSPAHRLTKQWKHGDRVRAGDTIATGGDDKPIGEDGEFFVLLPVPEAKVGDELFYLGEKVTEEEAQELAGEA